MGQLLAVLRDWRWDRWDVRQVVVSLIVLGILLALVLLALRLRARRLSSVEGVRLEPLHSTHPCFYQVMLALARSGDVKDLLERKDVQSAWKVVQRSQDRQTKAKPRTTGSILLNGGDRSDRLEAAILTILRAVVMDEKLARRLSPSVVAELDSYLEHLTERA